MTRSLAALALLAGSADALAAGLLDVRRLSDALVRVAGHVEAVHLDQISPLAVPVMLEVGREPIRHGEAMDAIMAEASEEDLIFEAMRV